LRGLGRQGKVFLPEAVLLSQEVQAGSLVFGDPELREEQVLDRVYLLLVVEREVLQVLNEHVLQVLHVLLLLWFALAFRSRGLGLPLLQLSQLLRSENSQLGSLVRRELGLDECVKLRIHKLKPLDLRVLLYCHVSCPLPENLERLLQLLFLRFKLGDLLAVAGFLAKRLLMLDL